MDSAARRPRRKASPSGQADLRRAAASRTRRAKDTGAVKMKIRGVRIMKKALGPIVLAAIAVAVDQLAKTKTRELQAP